MKSLCLFRLNTILCCCIVLLSACRTAPPDPSPATAPELAVIPKPISCVREDDPLLVELNQLFVYQQRARTMASSDLVKAIVDLNLQLQSSTVLMQKAILFASLRGNGDLVHAMSLLDQILKSTEPEAEHLKPLAGLLSANYAEWHRLDDNQDRLNQQLRDGQRRVEQLSDKLEALKNIERTLSERPGLKAPDSVTPAGQSTSIP